MDTATLPDADTNYPSWGTFTIVSLQAAGAGGDISDIVLPFKYYQCGDPKDSGPWWAVTYDEDTGGSRICDVGCALTSFAMVLGYYGVLNNGLPYDPGSLNNKLDAIGGFDSDEGVKWTSVSSLTGKKWEVLTNNVGSASRAEMTTEVDAWLSAGKPVIIGFPLTASSSGEHFVVAIGKKGGVYDIVDPVSPNISSLSHYAKGMAFTSEIRFQPPGSGSFVLYADAGVEVLVTDSVGRRVGYSGGAILSEVAGASYGDEQIAEDDPDNFIDHTTPLTHVLFIPSPAEGFYQVQFTGVSILPPGTTEVRLYRYNSQNLPQTSQTFSVNLGPGQTTSVSTTYSARVGDVNGDGFIDATDLAIVRASFGTHQGQPGYNPAADVNGDGVVDIRDLAFVAHFDPPPSAPPVVAPRGK